MRPEIPLKTRLEAERVRRAAMAIELVLADIGGVIRPGISTNDIENVALLSFKRHGLIPQLRGFQGYPREVCTSVNNVAAHGLPNGEPLRDGDLVTVDLSAELGGWMADAAWTYSIGSISNEAKRLLRAAWRATLAGARAARAGSKMGDVAATIQQVAHRAGCRVIAEFTGHGIGRALHEDPVVLHAGERGTGEPIVPGMTLNIEPVLTTGTGSAMQLADGHSYATTDGSLAAQFEVTVSVRSDATTILTLNRFSNLSESAPPYG